MALGLVGQYVGVSAPAMKQSDLNRDANWAARDQLAQCHDERAKLLDKLLEHQ